MTPAQQRFDEFAELRDKVNRHEKDLYYGNGKPGLTTRIELVENCMDRICKNLSKITWLIVAVFLTMLADLIVKVVH